MNFKYRINIYFNNNNTIIIIICLIDKYDLFACQND